MLKEGKFTGETDLSVITTPDSRLNNFYVAGFASCLNLYMDLLPYFDLVWIGEGRDYNRLPDHWLVEVSGIPFGLPGQCLKVEETPGAEWYTELQTVWGGPETHLT